MNFDLLDLLRTPPVREVIRRIIRGLKAPRYSGEYKYARYALLRLFGPSSVSAVSTAAILLTALMFTVGNYVPPPLPDGIVATIKPKTVDTSDLDIPEDKPKDEKKEEPKPDDPQVENDLPAVDHPSAIAGTGVEQLYSSGSDPNDPESGADGDQKMSEDPFAPRMTISSVIVDKLYPNRKRKGRETALQTHGDGPGSTKITEGAVLKALRWLKKNQESDGSWSNKSGGGNGNAHGDARAAMTSLALLTYLARGETPSSVEFGPTVEKSIRWLLDRQSADGSFQLVAYEHPIAAYALCEAYTMTRLPSLLEAATKATAVIIRGQNPSGGFSYELQPCDRNDTSVMGWCVQALKAAKIAGLECEGLDNALKRALDGFRLNYQGQPAGGTFGYTGPGVHPWTAGGLTGVGVLCNQMLGAQKSPEARGGLMHLQATDTFNWSGATWKNVYYWYYNTQARFHEGGECWKSWNKQFALPLAKAQIVQPKAIEGPDRKLCDIGYWDAKNDQGGRVMDTALCTLTLEVYYRYLPTFNKPSDEPATAKAPEKNEDIRIEALRR